MLSFELRQYDPLIGRWISPDPYNQYHSPYVGMGNRPHIEVDMDGGISAFGSIFFKTVKGAAPRFGSAASTTVLRGWVTAGINAGIRNGLDERNNFNDNRTFSSQSNNLINNQFQIAGGGGGPDDPPKKDKVDKIDPNEEPILHFFTQQLKKLNLSQQAEDDFNTLFSQREKRDATGNLIQGVGEELIEKLIQIYTNFQIPFPVLNPDILTPKDPNDNETMIKNNNVVQPNGG